MAVPLDDHYSGAERRRAAAGRCHGISKAYGDAPLFHDLSVEIRAGERWAITGPSGVGKTTLGDALLRLTSVEQGSVTHGAATHGGRLQKLYQDPARSFPRRVPLAVGLRDVNASPRRRQGSPSIAARHRRAASGHAAPPTGPGLRGRAAEDRDRPRQVAPTDLIFTDEATLRLDLVTQQTAVDTLMSEVADSGCALLLVTHDRQLAACLTSRAVSLNARERPTS